MSNLIRKSTLKNLSKVLMSFLLIVIPTIGTTFLFLTTTAPAHAFDCPVKAPLLPSKNSCWPPDGDIYCYKLGQRLPGNGVYWKYHYLGMEYGNTTANKARCKYMIQGDEIGFVPYTLPVNWT